MDWVGLGWDGLSWVRLGVWTGEAGEPPGCLGSYLFPSTRDARAVPAPIESATPASTSSITVASPRSPRPRTRESSAATAAEMSGGGQ
jgi:hypothetical protein